MTNQEIFNREAKERIWGYNDRINQMFDRLENEFEKNGKIYTKEFSAFEKKIFLNIEAYTTRRNLIYSIMINTVNN